MPTAKQLPSGSWYTRVYLGKDAAGKAIYKTITRRTKNECLRDALDIKEHHREITRDNTSMTLGEAIDRYIESKSNILSPSTIRGYSQIRRNHFKPEMDTRLNKLTTRELQRAINREARDYSPKSVKNWWGLISTVLMDAGIDVGKVTLPQKEAFEGKTLSPAEIGRFMAAIEGDPAEVPLLLALCLGLRMSEILALKWDDYDGESILVHAALVPDQNNMLVEKTTKTTKSKRRLPLPKNLISMLDSTERADEHIVTLSASWIAKRKDKACDKAGLPRIRIHDLRHTNASVMLALGIADKYAMERGGWSNSQTLKNIYQHTMTSERDRADALVNEFFEAVTK